jgi:hypothetical protein
MFRALKCPSSGARQTAIADSGFRMNVGVEVFSAVFGLLVGSTCFGRHYHPSSEPENNSNYSIWQPLHRIVVSCYRRRVGTDLSVLWVA